MAMTDGNHGVTDGNHGVSRHAFLSVKFLYFSAGYKDIFCKLIARKDVLLIVEHDGIIRNYYPTALKGCRGIVFTHGVQMGGRAGGGK